MDTSVLVVGLDGACWGLINRWIEAGELPNIEQLKKNGCWGDLRSCIPPVTCPAWKCYSTGKNPGKLGVYWWNSIDLKERKIKIAHSSLFHSEEIWDYLNLHGIKTGIIGMPLTYPPKKVNGFMISGGLDASGPNYVFPRQLKRVLDKIGYKVHPQTAFAGEIEKEGPEVKEILQLIKLRFKAAEKLMEVIPVNFLQITSFYLNSPLQHFFHTDKPVEKAWKLIDEEIGKIRDKFKYVIIMSDHGTASLEEEFFLNAWLKKRKYLYREKTFGDILNRLGLNITNIARVLDMLHIKNLLARFEISRKIGEKFPEEPGTRRGLGGEATLEGVDWEKTKAIALPQGPVYITNKKRMKKDDYEFLRNELIYEMKKIKSRSGKSVFSGVYRPDDIYNGPFVNKAPDIIALDSDNFHNKGGLLSERLFAKGVWKGNNAMYGLFCINGPGISSRELKEISIYDIAPTILGLFGCPIPADMDGQTLIHASSCASSRRDNLKLE